MTHKTKDDCFEGMPQDLLTPIKIVDVHKMFKKKTDPVTVRKVCY